MLIPKNPPYRSAKWRKNVASLRFCVVCKQHKDVQAAHRNEGKGWSMKVDDCLCAAICPECHHEIDNGKDMTLAERRAMLDKAIVETLSILAKQGLVKPL